MGRLCEEFGNIKLAMILKLNKEGHDKLVGRAYWKNRQT